MTTATFPPAALLPAGTLSERFPLLRLLNPYPYTRATWIALVIGVALGIGGVRAAGLPLWSATAIVLLTLLPVGIVKWRADLRKYGWVVTLLGILLTSQGIHTIEHVAQWLQYHVLYWTMRQSSGLISAANAEWVHFVWNWSVLIVVALLVRGGMRNVWAWALLGIALFHGIEHTYTFIRHYLVLGELSELGVTTITAQGLPGIVGRDGWLARSAWTQGTFLCSIPGVTTAVRLDVHFWWNIIETGFALLAGHWFLRGLMERGAFLQVRERN